MTLQSRFDAIERAARRRRWRGYRMTPVIPELRLDAAVLTELTELAELAELPVRDLTRFGGGPVHVMQAHLDVARLMLADPEIAERWISAIDRARAVSPVLDTGASEHE